jgi:hypothetical protein
MVLTIEQECLICFENRICPPLSYGCCHFDICPICLAQWIEVNHGIVRCPVCREIQFDKPLKICCFRCTRPNYEQRRIWYQILLSQIIFIFFIMLILDKLKN